LKISLPAANDKGASCQCAFSQNTQILDTRLFVQVTTICDIGASLSVAFLAIARMDTPNGDEHLESTAASVPKAIAGMRFMKPGRVNLKSECSGYLPDP
jgi:hypothetical protein